MEVKRREWVGEGEEGEGRGGVGEGGGGGGTGREGRGAERGGGEGERRRGGERGEDEGGGKRRGEGKGGGGEERRRGGERGEGGEGDGVSLISGGGRRCTSDDGKRCTVRRRGGTRVPVTQHLEDVAGVAARVLEGLPSRLPVPEDHLSVVAAAQQRGAVPGCEADGVDAALRLMVEGEGGLRGRLVQLLREG